MVKRFVPMMDRHQPELSSISRSRQMVAQPRASGHLVESSVILISHDANTWIVSRCAVAAPTLRQSWARDCKAAGETGI